MTLDLATCSYQEFTPDMGVPVRFTVGHPRWKLPYALAGHARLITPTRELLSLDKGPYREAYTKRLDAIGMYRIRSELEQITVLPGPLVLLCFEKLTGREQWCHRTMFAQWWQERTGQEVPELGAMSDPEPPTLF